MCRRKSKDDLLILAGALPMVWIIDCLAHGESFTARLFDRLR